MGNLYSTRKSRRNSNECEETTHQEENYHHRKTTTLTTTKTTNNYNCPDEPAELTSKKIIRQVCFVILQKDVDIDNL